MNRLGPAAALACALAAGGHAARCTTVAGQESLREYDRYVAAAEPGMAARFEAGDLAWMPAGALPEGAARLAAGKAVRWNISDPAVNRRIAGLNGTIIHWVGAIRIAGASLADVRSVLEDYDHYDRIYRPMIFECQARRTASEPAGYEAVLGLYSRFRFASVFPQHYSFQAKVHIGYQGASEARIHLRADEIRESDSGLPGHDDYLEPYHDHGIMWALNAYWRTRRVESGVYLEFETITLARSVEEFACKLGFIPVPKAVVSAVMDTLPGDSVDTILEGTKAECERRLGRSGR